MPTTHPYHRVVTWLAYLVGVPVFAVAFSAWFGSTFGRYLAQTSSYPPHDEPMPSVLVGCYRVVTFPVHYLFADGLIRTDQICIWLDGAFWGIIVVSIGLFISRRLRRST